MEKVCKHCGTAYVIARYREDTAHFCSLPCFQAYRSQNGMEPYQHAPKLCRYCAQPFIPKTGRAVYCYGEGCRSKGTNYWRYRHNDKRRNERRKLQEHWGFANSRHLGCKGGKIAEEAAPGFLKNLAFENIVVAVEHGVNFPWDIIAERGGQKYVIQVTMSVRAVHKYSRAAQALGVHWAVLFIKPDLTRAILKVPPDHIKSTYLKAKEVMPL